MSESVDIEAVSRTGTEILESSRLEVLVPHASDVDIARLIHELGEGSRDISAIEALNDVPQRRSLFYDESIPVFVIMEHDPETQLGEDQYKSYISRVAISMEVVAVEGQSKSEQTSRPNDGIHVLHVATLDDQNSTRIRVDFHGKYLSVWKVVVPLGHPRTRLSSPKVLFAVVASIKPFEGLNEKVDHDYLTSRNVFGVNLLEAYSDDSFLGGPRPQLSALRVSRVSPAGHILRETSGSISHRSKRMFHLFPALNVRLRHSEVGTITKQNVIASLDIDISAGDIVLNKVGLTLTGGKAELIGGPLEALLPMTCRLRDEVTFLYSLDHRDPTNVTTPVLCPVTLSLEANVLVSNDCHPLVKSVWSTSIEISGTKVLPPTRMSRAMSGPMQYGTTIMSASGIRTTGPSPETSPVLHFSAPYQLPSHDANGLVMTFSGPARVYVGEVFTWTVFVVNRSSRPRKLALVVPHKRWKADSGKVLPPAAHDGTGYVMDEGAVYTAHRSQILEPAELVCLMNDVRIGLVSLHHL
ncbi:TRAPP trafficking subunit Trs65-domain-containing protein [Terfezia claveryi]|nr:TRAPP trafficking subunit Trs65-domain-containing protein [Terfezia claveryi]